MGDVPGSAYNLTTFANLYKRVFFEDNKVDIFNFNNALLKLIKVTDGFVGSDEERVRASSFMGGYGFGALPYANPSNLIRPRITAKKYYARSILDTEAIAAAMKSPGAFFDLVNRNKLEINRSVENGLALALARTNIDGDLHLGTISGAPSGSDPYVITISAATWHANSFHIKQILNIETGNTDKFEVTAISAANRQVTVDRLTGSQAPADTDEVFLQGSEATAFTGLPAAVAQSGTLYNVTIGEANNWIARSTAMASVGITKEKLFAELMQVKNKVGKTPNLIVMGLPQYLAICNLLEGDRVTMVPSADAMKNDAVMGHSGIKIMADEGLVDVIWDRHIQQDRIYFLHKDHVELRKRPMSGMVEQAGELLLPDYINDADRYILNFRCYGDFFIEPPFVSVLTGLAVPT